MSVIYVVRHGQDLDNANRILNGHRNEALTPTGKEQAKATGVRLLAKDVGLIYSSPALRAQQTAKIISSILGIEKIIIEPELIERDFGVLTGRPVADIAKYCKNIFVGDRINYFLDGEGVETFADLLLRAKRVLDKIIENDDGVDLLLVTHGDTARMIEAAWHGWTWEHALTMPYFENAEIIELKR